MELLSMSQSKENNAFSIPIDSTIGDNLETKIKIR